MRGYSATLSELHSLKICRKALAHTRRLCRRIDTDKDEICLLDAAIHFGGKEQVPSPALLDNGSQAGFVHWQVEELACCRIWVAIPCSNASGINVDNRDCDIGTIERDDGAGRATYIASSNAADVLDGL